VDITFYVDICLNQLIKKEKEMRSTSEINSNFKIKVNGKNFKGQSMSKLVGVRGLVSLLGEDISINLIERAFSEGKDITICKLRRGLTVRFYSI
jgi:hypothetical protein